MKVAHAEKHVLDTGGLQQAQAFQMRANAHAFKMLSSGMYSDKVMAVLREISCNAHDAHIAQGIPQQPFVVKLPNKLDNQFYIRDHGTGLSHESVMNLYVTYFASTKQESNDFTGAFGLGSKSPFSYTDSFTVTSCHGGKKRIYSAHVNNLGVPTIALMNETDAPADWQTGLEVGFPVKPQDFEAFADRAVKVFRFFDPIPAITGSTVALKRLPVTRDYGTYAFIENSDPKMIVQMGNVAYPLNLSEITQGRTEVISTLARANNLLIRFKLGELQVTGSRESLQYDPATQKAIVGRLAEVVGNIGTELETEFMKAGTWSDLCAFRKTVEAVGHGIYVNKDFFRAAGITDARLMEACEQRYAALPAVPATVNAHYCILETQTRGGLTFMKVTRPTGVASRGYVDFTDDITIVHGTESNATGRVRKALIEGTLRGKIVLVSPSKADQGGPTDVFALFTIIKQRFKGVPEHRLSEFPAPPTPPKSKRAKAKGFPPLGSDKITCGDKIVEIKDVTHKVYTVVKRTHSWGNSNVKWRLGKDKLIEPYDVTRLAGWIATLEELPGVKIGPFVQVSYMEMKRLMLDKRPDWTLAVQHIENVLSNPQMAAELDKLAKSDKYVVDLQTYYSNRVEGLLNTMVYTKEHNPKIYSELAPILKKHNMLDVIERVHKNSKSNVKKRHDGEPPALNAARSVSNLLGIKIATPEYQKVVEALGDKFENAKKLKHSFISELDELAPKAAATVLDELLNRG